ncbi:GGDEF domain-containing protein [Paenibacillus sacheonensis]|uniref:Diguanylate cyclase n=1 Tax=Paenibacillus sacheonensis TaxID=742054 RepID=A0A7X5C3H1_9BACL|nr:diguanylate cyclase [Paenibacillus sacheonensis]MBM7567536.1 diguanylate cyclase (GGDEF)-like protein [Paenibacillus sacheonensis]NBC71359.1 diguanylate cyclase [Paenibacillus sacheonensis]
MMLLLDSQTVLLSLGIGYIFTFVLVSAYWHEHMKAATVKMFFIAKSAQMLSWYLMILRGEIADFLSISFANSILLAGAALEIIALLRLRGELRPMTKMIYLGFTAVSIAGFHLILLVHNEENIRIAYCSFVFALLLLPAYRLAFGKNHSLLLRLMGCLYLLTLAGTLARGAAALFFDASIPTSFYTSGQYQMIATLALYLITIMENMAFVLLLKERSNQELVRLASYDDLTGALNRRTFAERAGRCLADHAKKGAPLSYLLFDIDWFKNINDTYGHHVGDQVLQDLTSRIRQNLGHDDLFVRYGGDEFGLLLPGKDEAASNALAERVNHALKGTMIAGLPITYTISMGVLTLVPDPYTELETLYTCCDKALYAAKRNGRSGTFRGRLPSRSLQPV